MVVRSERLEGSLFLVGIHLGVDHLENLSSALIVEFGGSSHQFAEIVPGLAVREDGDVAAESRVLLDDIVAEGRTTFLGEVLVVERVAFRRGEGDDLELRAAVVLAEICERIERYERFCVVQDVCLDLELVDREVNADLGSLLIALICALGTRLCW